MLAEEMPPRAGKGARRRGGGRPPRGGPYPPAVDSINRTQASAGEGVGRGVGTLPGAGARGDEALRPPAGVGRRGGGPSPALGRRIAPLPPHSRGARSGSELGCPFSPPPADAHTSASGSAPKLGVGARPPSAAGLRLGGARCPARSLFMSITLVTGVLGIDSSLLPFAGGERGAAGAQARHPQPRAALAAVGSRGPTRSGAPCSRPRVVGSSGASSAPFTCQVLGKLKSCLGCNRRKRRRTSRRRKMQFP